MSLRKTVYLAMASLLVSAGLAALAPSADAATPHRGAGHSARHHSAAPHHSAARPHHSARRHSATRQARAARPAATARRGADGESAQVDALNQQSLQAARGGAAAQ